MVGVGSGEGADHVVPVKEVAVVKEAGGGRVQDVRGIAVKKDLKKLYYP